MDEARIVIERLRKRISDIIAEKSKMSRQIGKMESERERLLKDKTALEQKVSDLERRIKVLELSQGVTAVSGGNKPARDRINKLLREVDKCLALMNK